MAGRLQNQEYALRIHPALLHNARHFARLHGETLKKWLTEAIVAKLEDEIDEARALEAMTDDEDAMPLEDFLDLQLIRKRQGEQSRPFRDYLEERKRENLNENKPRPVKDNQMRNEQTESKNRRKK